MQNNLTELVFILDKSGSMGGLEKDTIGGFNSMLEKQKEKDGECNITTVLFDNTYELLHDRLDIRGVNYLDESSYQVGGMTALCDAVGLTIDKLVKVQKNTLEEFRAKKVMFVIITDGEENSSREFTAKQIKKKISYQKEKFGWEFIFLGANIDAVKTASRYGIDEDRTGNFHPDAMGTNVYFESIDRAITSFREENQVSNDWSKKLKSDFKSRKSRRK